MTSYTVFWIGFGVLDFGFEHKLEKHAQTCLGLFEAV